MIAATVEIDAYGVTDPGKVRDHNEDQFLIAGLNKSILVDQTSLSKPDHARLMSGTQGKLLVVADGMGGEGGGEIASTVAVDAILNYVLNVMPWFLRLNVVQESDLRDELKTALQRSHASVVAAADVEGEHPRMGTTLTMAYVVWPRLYVVHVGDSRCYLYREPVLKQVTTDHTVAEQMAQEEIIPHEQASSSRWSNVLWNSLGGGGDVPSPEVYKAELVPGDVMLLCTDGLTKHVSDDELRDHFRSSAGPSEKDAAALVEAANRGGGSDNVTAVVARFR